MASASEIAAVSVQLPDEATALGVDSDIISTFLDTPLSQIKTILACWRAIAAKTATMTDVNENGSSRNLSKLNDNARQMITYWQTQADREDNQNDTFPRQRFASHTAVRV